MSKFKFIDLFAGIGGFHIAMHNLGGECVFASEIDEHARKTYQYNLSKISPQLFDNNLFNKDIRNISPSEIPDFDILCAGFPCQPFSQAGLKRGFNDNHNSERGNLFFYIAEILQAKQPKAFFLENVRGLLNHDNGNTFKVIRNILEVELGYSFYYKIVNAKDYGLPQLRPRLFMIGFKDEGFMKSFNFPENLPLKYTMSDVWNGVCNREIGFTLRVGGRGSNIDDRRNWDHYLVNGEVKRISSFEAKKMQGFPDDYTFPVSETQAMKQLGNSVAIDAIQEVGRQLLQHMKSIKTENIIMNTTLNKGEWSELLVFLKCLYEQKIPFGDINMNETDSIIDLKIVSNQNDLKEFHLDKNRLVTIIDKKNKLKRNLNIDEVISKPIIDKIKSKITNGSGTFEIEEFEVIKTNLDIKVSKGGNSNQKADIHLDFNFENQVYENQGMGIKSYIGSKPTLLNASSNTNFIFRVTNLEGNKIKGIIDEVNAIDTRFKLKDRIKKIKELGGAFTFVGAEKDSLDFNLKMVDTKLPELIGEALMKFYFERINTIKAVVNSISENKTDDELKLNINIFKRFLISVLLGFFAGEKWNGEYDSNGTIVIKSSGNMLAYHIIKLEVLKDYLFEHMKFDTPSTSRHSFGKLYTEKDGQLYFKLNLQLRFK